MFDSDTFLELMLLKLKKKAKPDETTVKHLFKK